MERVKRGDVFCVRSSDGIISSAICAWQWFWSVDCEASYSHSGVIIDDKGNTIEALYNGIRRANIYDRYPGKQIIIGRIVGLTDEEFQKGYQRIASYEGKPYPYLRLFLHLFPPFAKFFHLTKSPVCSELTWLYVGEGNVWGITPDIVADRIKYWDLFDVIFEGEL